MDAFDVFDLYNPDKVVKQLDNPSNCCHFDVYKDEIFTSCIECGLILDCITESHSIFGMNKVYKYKPLDRFCDLLHSYLNISNYIPKEVILKIPANLTRSEIRKFLTKNYKEYVDHSTEAYFKKNNKKALIISEDIQGKIVKEFKELNNFVQKKYTLNLGYCLWKLFQVYGVKIENYAISLPLSSHQINEEVYSKFVIYKENA
jgi:hypothetical protein